MIAKDGERVNFKTPFEPKDEVEIWLSRLSLKIREELMNVLSESKAMADEYFASTDYKDD